MRRTAARKLDDQRGQSTFDFAFYASASIVIVRQQKLLQVIDGSKSAEENDLMASRLDCTEGVHTVQNSTCRMALALAASICCRCMEFQHRIG